jgi:succinate dehydrogenase/fumarate reductase-like Fe-S protein
VRSFRKRVLALLHLAWRLLLHLVCAPFQRSGLSRFQENYRADRIFALEAPERAVFGSFSRCIGCGLCDAALATSESAGHLSPSALAMSESRSLPDLDAASTHAREYLESTGAAASEAACPVGVPLRHLATFVVAHGQTVAPQRSSPP